MQRNVIVRCFGVMEQIYCTVFDDDTLCVLSRALRLRHRLASFSGQSFIGPSILTGQTIDFLLTAKRDTAAAKRFFQRVSSCPANPVPRVINVDKNPAYPAATRILKKEGALPRQVRLRQYKYLNNVIEQDHRLVRKRTWLAKGYNTFQIAWRTFQGIEDCSHDSKGTSSTGS